MELRMIHVASGLQRGVGHTHLATLGEPAGLALLPVGGSHLTRPRLSQRSAAERLVFVTNLVINKLLEFIRLEETSMDLKEEAFTNQ